MLTLCSPLKGADFSEEDINHVCKAMFCDQGTVDMRGAWNVFVKEIELPNPSLA